MHGAAAVRPVPEAVQFQRGLLSQPVLRGRRQEALSPAAAEPAVAACWRRTGTDVPAPGGFALGCLSTGTGLMDAVLRIVYQYISRSFLRLALHHFPVSYALNFKLVTNSNTP